MEIMGNVGRGERIMNVLYPTLEQLSHIQKNLTTNGSSYLVFKNLDLSKT